MAVNYVSLTKCWMPYRSASSARYPRFQLSETLCENDFRFGQRFQLSKDMELLRLERQGAGIERDTRAGGDSHTGFQRQHGGIRDPLSFLNRWRKNRVENVEVRPV